MNTEQPKREPKRLYAVQITYDAIVVAESLRDAQRVAEAQRRSIVGNEEPSVVARGEVRSCQQAQFIGWEPSAIPYGQDGYVSVARFLERATKESRV